MNQLPGTRAYAISSPTALAADGLYCLLGLYFFFFFLVWRCTESRVGHWVGDPWDEHLSARRQARCPSGPVVGFCASLAR